MRNVITTITGYIITSMLIRSFRGSEQKQY
nr:MAG TPA: hypothetical protein [Caudoviricetes sp.]